MTIACFSSFSFAYASRARVLARSVRAAHPDWVLHALVVDRPPPGFDADAALAGFDYVIYADMLGIPRFAAWMFKHDVVEGCTAVKGRMLLRLLEQGASAVVFLDPDIAVFHPLEPVERALSEASIVLTPHQTAPNTTLQAIRDNERTSMLYGVFNLGFAAVRADANGFAFARWWTARLEEACYDAVGEGLFTDQRYCDLVPGLFDRVAILRDPGCNVASWNLSTREIAIGRDGGIRANGDRLRFFHFTKFAGAGEIMTPRYAGDNIEVYELWQWYHRQLVDDPLPDGWWHYGVFTDGTPIAKSVRLAYRGDAAAMARVADPFIGPPR